MRKLALVIAIVLISGSAEARGHHGGHVPWCGIWMMGHTGIHGPGNLARAIELNPRNRLQARADNDFQSMVDDPRFTELLYPEVP